MGKKLSQIVTIIENNYDCVVLKVKKNQAANLIALGCFNGDEKMFRLTKGRDHNCTVWHGDDSKHYSWYWGESGYTLVSDKLGKQGSIIQKTITDDFGIYIGADTFKKSQTLYKKKPAPKTEKFVAMWWGGQDSIVVHRNGEFWKGFGSHSSFTDYINSIGGKVESKSDLYHSPNTGCCMMDYTIVI